MAPKREQHTDQSSHRKKAHHRPVSGRKRTLFATEPLRHRPCPHQHHKYARVLPSTRMPDKALVMLLPSGLPADPSPILAAVRRIEAIAEHSWNQHANDFFFGQAPLRREIPVLLFGFFRGFGMSQRLHCAGYKIADALRGQDSRKDGHHRHGSCTACGRPNGPSPFPPARDENVCGHEKAIDGAIIRPLGHRHPDREPAQNQVERGKPMSFARFKGRQR